MTNQVAVVMTVFSDPAQLSAMSGDLLPAPVVEPTDVADAVAFPASGEARDITGVTLPSTPAVQSCRD